MRGYASGVLLTPRLPSVSVACECPFASTHFPGVLGMGKQKQVARTKFGAGYPLGCSRKIDANSLRPSNALTIFRVAEFPTQRFAMRMPLRFLLFSAVCLGDCPMKAPLPPRAMRFQSLERADPMPGTFLVVNPKAA